MDISNERVKRNFGTMACTALLKSTLMLFNLIFTTIGLLILIVGIYGLKAFKYFFTFTSSENIYVPVICIGLFMSIVGILSLYCTPKGVTWLLYLYSFIIFIFFLSIFTVSILFMVRRDTFEQTINTGLKNAIQSYPEQDTAVDLLQENIKCCGVNNYTDWFETKWSSNMKKVPKSCCKKDLEGTCQNENLTRDNVTDIYEQGCYAKMYETIESKFILIGSIGFVSSVVILLGAFLSCCLTNNLSRNRYEQVA